MADSTAKTLEDDAVELEEDPPVEHSKEIKEIVLYIVFMFFFTFVFVFEAYCTAVRSVRLCR